MSSSRQQSDGNGGTSTQTASRKCEMVQVPFPAPVVKMIGDVMASVTSALREGKRQKEKGTHDRMADVIENNATYWFKFTF